MATPLSCEQHDGNDPLLTTIPTNRYDYSQLPTIFAYPHFYEPHPIAKYACDEVKRNIETLSIQNWTEHSFFNNQQSDNAVGKMFGVLVVSTDKGSLGYLKAYSGTITGVTHSEEYGFCPTLYNRFDPDRSGFSYLTEEAELNKMNRRIEELQTDPKRKELQLALDAVKEQAATSLSDAKLLQKEQKKQRKQVREQMRGELTPEEFVIFDADLAQQKSQTYQGRNYGRNQ